MGVNLGSAYGSVILDFRTVQAAVQQTVRSLNSFEQQARAVGDRLSQVGNNIKSVGDNLTASLTLPMVAAGVAASKMSMDFEESMQHIVGLVGVSQDQVNAWSQDLQRMGAEVGKGPKELAEAMYFVTSSGLAGKEALDAVEQSARAASAGLGDTKVVADAVTSAMNAYRTSNLTAAQATDILVATVREGKGDADQIAPALGRVIPIAAQLGVSFEEVGAALAGMTLVGFDASEAATNLSGILSAFIKPSKQASEVLADFGLSGEQVRQTLDEKGLLATLELLNETIGRDDEALAKIYPNIRGFRGALALVGENAEQVRGIFSRMANTTGDADRAFQAAAQTAKFQFNAAMSGVQRSLIQFGNAILPVVIPILKQLAETIQRVAEWFTALDKGTQQTIVQIGILAAAIGPVLSIGGRLVTVVGSLINLFTTLGSALATAAKAAGSFAKTAFEVVQYLWEAGSAGLAAAGAFAAIAAALVIMVKFFDAASRAARATNDELIAMANSNTGNIIEDTFNRAGASFEIIVNGNQRLQDVLDATHEKIKVGAKNYEDYRASIEATAEAAGYEIDAAGNLIKVQYGMAGRTERVIKANYALAESQYQLVQAQARVMQGAYGVNGALDESNRAAGRLQTEIVGLGDAQSKAVADANAFAEAQKKAAEESEAAEAKLEQLRALIDGPVGAAYEEFKSKQDDLKSQMGDVSGALEENARAWDEHLKRILFDIATEQLAVGGLTQTEVEALTTIAEKWGLIDSATAEATLAVLSATSQLAEDGNAQAFAGNMQVALARTKTAAEEARDGIVTALSPLEEAYRDAALAAQTHAGQVGTATTTMAGTVKTQTSVAHDAFMDMTRGFVTNSGTVVKTTTTMANDVGTAVLTMDNTLKSYGPEIGKPLATGFQTSSSAAIEALNALLDKIAEVINAATGINLDFRLPTPGGGGGGGPSGGGGGGGPSGGGGGSTPSCFVAGTPIVMADGSLKAIEKIDAGDRVLAFVPSPQPSLNPHHFRNSTGTYASPPQPRRVGSERLVVGEVAETSARLAYSYFELWLDDGTCLHVTGEHPIYAPQVTREVERVHGLFVPVAWLEAGDVVETIAGCATVVSNHIVSLKKPVTVYNFNVAEQHTYIAGPAGHGVLVHNIKARARGGMVFPGLRYLLNESGLTRPELIVPKMPGYALTRQDAMASLTRAAALGTGGVTQNITVTVPVGKISNEIDIEMVAMRVADHIRRRR